MINRLERDGALCACGAPALYMINFTPVCLRHAHPETPSSDETTSTTAEEWVLRDGSRYFRVPSGEWGRLQAVVQAAKTCHGHTYTDERETCGLCQALAALSSAETKQ